MRTVAVGRRNALIIVTAMSLAGCGGSQPPIGAAGMLTIIGLVQGEHGQYPRALQSFEQTPALYQLGNHRRGATTFSNIDNIQEDQGRLADTLQSYQQALALFQQVGDQASAARVARSIGEVQSLMSPLQSPSPQPSPTRDPNNDGFALLHTGENQFRQRQYADALHTYQEALALFQQLRDRDGEAKALMNIGLVQEDQLQYADALQSEQQALALFRQQDDRVGEARTLDIIGFLQGSHGQYALALQLFEQALTLYRQSGDPDGEARALNNIGITQSSQGQYAVALQSFEQALALYRQLRDREAEAQTLGNIGTLQRSQGQFSDALQSYQQALALFQQVGDQASAATVERSIGEVQSLMSAPPSPSPHPSPTAYPIPFESEPDWQTDVHQYPTGPVGQLVPNNRLNGSLILIRLIAKSESLTAEEAARIAYDGLFVTYGARSPGPGSVVVMAIYGRPDSRGSISEFGFVFRHDSGNGWEPRPVAKRDVAAILSALQQPQETSKATATTENYPIPFNKNADYRGGVSVLPPNMPFSLISKARVLDRALVVYQMSTVEALSDTQTAGYAYFTVFKNERRLPHGAVYVVVNIYGMPSSYEPGGSVLFFPQTGYVFSRDSGGRWRPRPVSKKEFDAVAKLVLPPRMN
jgi:tetratricopeptide (TPR) repeat protein